MPPKETHAPTTQVSPSMTPTPKPPKPLGPTGSWKLMFSDEFNTMVLDQNRWKTCHWWGEDGCTISTNDELEWYQPNNVRVQDGMLVLEAQKQEVHGSDGKSYQYTSGMVSSGRATSDRTQSPGFSFKYGFAEIRARVPSGQGLWPAFWMLPITHNPKPEIDIVEILGNDPDTIKMFYHYLSAEGNIAKSGGEWIGPDYSQDWHIFGVDWQPDQIIWYVDGVTRFKFTEAAYIPAEPMYLILNLAVGGNWPGSPNADTSFPSRFEIDYVRVFQRADIAYLDPVADTYVNSSIGKKNFGTDDTVYSDGEPTKITLLTYDTSPLAGKRLSSAFLRIHTTADEGSPSNDQHLISIVDSSDWKEGLVNFLSYLTNSDKSLGVIDKATEADTVYLFPLDVEQLQVRLGTVFSLSISSSGTDGLYLYSRESLRGGVQLILTFSESKYPE